MEPKGEHPVRRLLRGRTPALRTARALLATGAIVLLLLASLSLATGQAPGDALVVVRSSDMHHCANTGADGTVPMLAKDCAALSFGRLGSLDVGDVALLEAVGARGDVRTTAEGGPGVYGAPGDVIRVHVAPGKDPLLQRALFWVDVEADGSLSVPALGIHRAARLDQPQVQALTGCSLEGLRSSGFVVRGDANRQALQCPVGMQPIPMESVLGKASGEVPWLGLLPLMWVDATTESSAFGNAATDSKLGLLAVLLGLVAVVWGVWTWRRRKRGPTTTTP